MTNQEKLSSVETITNNKKPRALVICPKFFDYHQNVIREFEALGFEATWMNTRLYENPLYKIILRVAPSLIANISTKHHIRNTEGLRLENVAEILVIKGEGVSVDFIRYLRREFPIARVNLYLWDGVENTRGARQIAPEFHSVSTFDPRDARLFNWRYRPLFARKDEKSQITSSVAVVYDWAFIGSLHSDRFAVLMKLTRSNVLQNFYAYGYIPGKFMWFLRHVANPKTWRCRSIKVSTAAIPPEKVNRIVQSAKAVVDIEHPKQRGLTMRTIETLLLGRKLVTTNAEIRNSDLFHESRVCIIDRANPSIPQAFLEKAFLDIPQKTKEKYYVRSWLQEVIRP